MSPPIERREFIALLSGAAAASATPLTALAQQPTMPVVGYLSSLGRNDRPNLVEAFRLGLREAALAEGRSVAIEYRFAENQPDRLPALAVDLVARKVAVIAATGGGNTISATKASTAAIPIVFTYGGDPVQEGYVASLNRPGGNITGVSFFNIVLGGKALGLLHEIVPDLSVTALMVNPKTPESARTLNNAQKAAQTLGRKLLVLNASTPDEIDAAFANVRQARAGAILVGGDSFFTSRRQQIVALAARDAIPAMYLNREFVAEGGLMSYGNDVADSYRRAALYVGRILKGAKPADLPVDRATKFEFLINLKTAKALGITFPSGILAIVDAVIE
jgi:putative tryptophan/tyrosine transport system substrate-binding protein